jgi:hypothetical protein
VLVCACSLGGSAPTRAGSAPGKAAIVRWLQGLDRSGVSFSLSGHVNATGHERGGEIDMTANSVHLVLYDGVLYGRPPGSSKWLEMDAQQANFMWPAARLSLVWESILLSKDTTSPFSLPRNQLDELAGGLTARRGEILIPPSTSRVQVTVDGSASVFVPQGADPSPINPPSGATPGDVINLLSAGIAA